MGDCYSVNLRIKIRKGYSEVYLARKMREWMRDVEADYPEGLRVYWHLADLKRQGYTPDTFDGFCKILLAFQQGDGDVHTDDAGFRTYSSGFNASYGWMSVMIRAFNRMAFSLDEGSELLVDHDEGVERHRVYANEKGESEVWENTTKERDPNSAFWR